MTEIKSALEIALEKTQGIQGDKETLKNSKLKNDGKKLASAFLDPASDVDERVVLDKMKSLTSDEQKFYKEGFSDAMLANLTLPAIDTYSEKLKILEKGFQAVLKETLVKRTRVQYMTPDKSTIVGCWISKEHNPDKNPAYWFGFDLHQKDSLQSARNAYLAFGCGSSNRVILIPFSEFEPWLEGMSITQKDDRHRWHIII